MSKEISELQFSLHYASETDSEKNTSIILTVSIRLMVKLNNSHN